MARPRKTAARDALRSAARLMGNVFFGIALGLLSYYAITNVITSLEQSTLKSAIAVGTYEDHSSEATSALDFRDWATQDAAYWGKLRKGGAFGRLVSRKMGLDAVVVKGHRREYLRKGPGWISYTNLPGPTGNCGISGHRTTYGAPFRHLDRLRPGDTIQFYSPYRRYTYRVRRVFSVTPDHTEVVRPTDKPTLTLTACHPPYSARYRLIVQSDLIAVDRLAE